MGASALQILVDDFDKLFGREYLRRFAPRFWIDHVFANVVFDDLGNEPVECAAACGGLLQHVGAFIVGLHRPLDRLDLAAQPLEAIQQFGLLPRNVTHGACLLLPYYTTAGYIARCPVQFVRSAPRLKIYGPRRESTR